MKITSQATDQLQAHSLALNYNCKHVARPVLRQWGVKRQSALKDKLVCPKQLRRKNSVLIQSLQCFIRLCLRKK